LFAYPDTTDYFLGKDPVGATNESQVDLSVIVRDVDELVILNDEAHHIHYDYHNANGAISDFYPDFLVKVSGKEIYIVETKGREDLDDPLEIERLRLGCEDVNTIQGQVRYVPLYVKQEEYEK
jgi:hypothetical protein